MDLQNIVTGLTVSSSECIVFVILKFDKSLCDICHESLSMILQ